MIRRKPKIRSGIERSPSREFPRHRLFVRAHLCAACEGWQYIEFAHYRTAANSGIGLKPPDWFGLPLCRQCHAEQHMIGQTAFERIHRIDLAAIAAGFARRSPDIAMKQAMKEARE